MLTEKLRSAMNCVERLEEAAYNPTTGRLKVKIIQSGFNKGKGRYYPAGMLERDASIFEGQKMFADHQTDSEAKQRPEGSVHNWVGQITNVKFDKASQAVVGEAAVIDPPFKAKLEELHKQGLLPQMGISIRAVGVAAPGKVDGHDTRVVESLTHARSVDFVTYPGAGGQVEAIESEELVSVETITLSQLREARPDLIALLETNKENTMTPQEQVEFDALKAKLAVAEAAKTTADAKATALETENKQIKEAQAKAVKVAEAQPKIAALIKEANLPEAASKRIAEQFKAAESVDGVKEAIVAEGEYLKAVKAPAKVAGMGANDEVKEGDVEKALAASFERLGMTKEQAQEAAGR